MTTFIFGWTNPSNIIKMNNVIESFNNYISIKTLFFFHDNLIMLVNPVSMLTSRWYLHMWKLSMCFPDHCLESAEEHKDVSILLSTCFQNVQLQKQIRNSLKAFTWHQVHDNMPTVICWIRNRNYMTDMFIQQEHGIAQRTIYCTQFYSSNNICFW